MEYYLKNPVLFKDVMLKTKPDLIHLVYTHIITNGVFPFKLELNTMNLRVVQNKLYSFFVPDEISPWSAKYHSSFIIGNFRYSLTPNNLMNISFQDERIYS